MNKTKYQECEDYFKSITPVYEFSPESPNNTLSKIDSAFGKICSRLTFEGYQNPKLMTKYDFEHAILFIEEKYKPKK